MESQGDHSMPGGSKDSKALEQLIAIDSNCRRHVATKFHGFDMLHINFWAMKQ